MACEKYEEKCMNYFSLVWVTFKHVKNIPGHDILDTRRKVL